MALIIHRAFNEFLHNTDGQLYPATQFPCVAGDPVTLRQQQQLGKHVAVARKRRWATCCLTVRQKTVTLSKHVGRLPPLLPSIAHCSPDALDACTLDVVMLVVSPQSPSLFTSFSAALWYCQLLNCCTMAHQRAQATETAATAALALLCAIDSDDGAPLRKPR